MRDVKSSRSNPACESALMSPNLISMCCSPGDIDDHSIYGTLINQINNSVQFINRTDTESRVRINAAALDACVCRPEHSGSEGAPQITSSGIPINETMGMDQLNLHQLRILAAVVEHGSFGQAA